MTLDVAYTLERIAATKAQIEAYEAAVLELAAANGVTSYTIDTGQTKQTVTRADIPRLQAVLDSLYSRLATLQQRAGVTSPVTGVPLW